MKTLIYTSQSIECQGCARSVTAALKALTGVNDVSVDVEAKQVSVHYDDAVLSETKLREASEDAGFPADS